MLKQKKLPLKKVVVGSLILLVLIIVGRTILFVPRPTSKTAVVPTPLPSAVPTLLADKLEEDEVTVDWQIYTQRQFNFSVKYPPEWEFVETESDPPDLAVKIYPERWRGQQLPWATSANITIDSSRSKKEEFNQLKGRKEEAVLDNQVEDVNFAGQACLQVTPKLPRTGGFGPRILCLKNNLVYQLQVFSYYLSRGEKELAEQILLTFKFLN